MGLYTTKVHLEDLTINASFTMHRQSADVYPFPHPLHLHTAFEIQCVNAGTFDFEFRNEIRTVRPGSLLLIPPRIFHQLRSASSDAKRITIEFAMEKNKSEGNLHDYYTRLFSAVKDDLVFVMDFSEFAGLQMVLEEMQTSYRSECVCLLQSYFTILFLKLAGEIANMEGHPRKIADENDIKPKDNIAANVILYIIDSYSEDISTASAAAHLNLSVRQLERIIQKQLNTTFSALLNEYRIRIAEQKICGGDTGSVSFETICSEVGYNSYFCFLKQFKLHAGCTPSEYRRAYIRGKDS